MSAGLTITSQIHFSMRNRGRREMKPGPAPITETTPEGSVPRVSRLMALAIKMDGLIRSGAVPDQGDRGEQCCDDEDQQCGDRAHPEP